MNIVVCVKYVPDATADRQFESDNTVDREGVDGLLSELDEYAVEQALQIKEKAEDPTTVTVTALTRRSRDRRRRGPQGAADGRRPGRPRRRRGDRRLRRASPPRWCWPRRSRRSVDVDLVVVRHGLDRRRDERRPGDARRAARPAAGHVRLGDRVAGRPGPDQARRRHRHRGDRRHDAAGAVGDRPVRRGALPVLQGDHGGEEEAAGDLLAGRPRRRRRRGRPVGRLDRGRRTPPRARRAPPARSSPTRTAPAPRRWSSSSRRRSSSEERLDRHD